MRTAKLVLGNGFDLYCGLKTRYSDFFEFNKKYYKKLDTLKEVVYGDDADYVNITLEELVKKLKKYTFWDLIFYLDPSRETKKNWMDVESFIKNFFYLNTNQNPLFDTIYFFYINNGLDIENYDESTLRLFFPIVYLYFCKHKFNSKEELANYLLKELIKFEQKFGIYVNKEFNDKLTDDFFRTPDISQDSSDINFKNFFIKNFKDILITSIDSFNYTPIDKIKYCLTCNNCYNMLPQCSIVHINSDWNSPIFGIDSSHHTVGAPGYYFSKTYRRMVSDFYEIENESNTPKFDFTDLFIFGHSLNEQDYSYYFPLFDYMNLLDITKTSRVIFMYYIYDVNKKEEIKSENIISLNKMLCAYEIAKTGRNNVLRLVDALSIRGRLKFKEIK